MATPNDPQPGAAMNQNVAHEMPSQQIQPDPGMPVPDPRDFGGYTSAKQEGASPDMDEWKRHIDENAQVWATQARESIREHPLGTVAAAVVAGLLLARLLR